VDYIKRGDIALIINTPLGRASHYDEQAIRRAALIQPQAGLFLSAGRLRRIRLELL
jgi:hypothetical protein